ncbi:hypothetical protein SOVF_095060, partial [Spinacia oleracea]
WYRLSELSLGTDYWKIEVDQTRRFLIFDLDSVQRAKHKY